MIVWPDNMNQRAFAKNELGKKTLDNEMQFRIQYGNLKNPEKDLKSFSASPASLR
jgi:hypothetical protein